MKIHCKYTGIKGFLTVYERALRYSYMITKEAIRRLKILIHWERYGMESAKHAFGVKRRTLFNWKARFIKGGKKPEALNPKSRTPQRKRKRIWNIELLEEIKMLRRKHPNLGSKKIYPLLLDFCDAFGIEKCPKPSTIERLIKDMGGLRIYPQKITGTGRVKKVNRQKVLRKPKDLIARYPGHVLALDTIEKQKDGRRMYILTVIDIFTRTAFAIGTRSHSSKTFAHFFFLIMQMFPYEIKNVLTDNGSEFKKYLNQLLKEKQIAHYHTYPKTPKMNAHCESFNGTIQDEFVDYHINLLFENITLFNEKMNDYLIFYNTKRVHYAFKNKQTPLEVLSHSNYYTTKLREKCKNGWGCAKVTNIFLLCYNLIIINN